MDKCANCRVPIFEQPEEVGAHEVQMITANDEGLFCCTACAFENEYKETGRRIVQATMVEADDEELAEMLADMFQVKELRPWLRDHDVHRSRGSSKLQSCREAVKQNRVAVASEVLRQTRGMRETKFTIMCNCGLEEVRYDRKTAVEMAQQHSVKEADCAAKVFDADEMIYGNRYR